MWEVLSNVTRKARKRHVCNFCGHPIEPGEKYNNQTNVFDGRAYTWKDHLECQDLCNEIWDFVDPDEGMDSDAFRSALRELSSTFVCKNCPHRTVREGLEDCDEELSMKCIRHIHKFFKEFELVRDRSCPYDFRVKRREK